jgi:hypothetical protein
MQNFTQHVKNLAEVITALHVLAVVIVNVTRTPKVFSRTRVSSGVVPRGYRVIELLAGIVTPLVKR